MQIRAAVARAANTPLSLELLELEDPRAGEILVRVVATGVCHTDLVVRDGMLPTPQPVCSDTKAPASSSGSARA